MGSRGVSFGERSSTWTETPPDFSKEDSLDSNSTIRK